MLLHLELLGMPFPNTRSDNRVLRLCLDNALCVTVSVSVSMSRRPVPSVVRLAVVGLHVWWFRIRAAVQRRHMDRSNRRLVLVAPPREVAVPVLGLGRLVPVDLSREVHHVVVLMPVVLARAPSCAVLVRSAVYHVVWDGVETSSAGLVADSRVGCCGAICSCVIVVHDAWTRVE